MLSIDTSSDDNSARRETTILLNCNESNGYKLRVHKLIQFHASCFKT